MGWNPAVHESFGKYCAELRKKALGTDFKNPFQYMKLVKAHIESFLRNCLQFFNLKTHSTIDKPVSSLLQSINNITTRVKFL